MTRIHYAFLLFLVYYFVDFQNSPKFKSLRHMLKVNTCICYF